MAEGPEIAARGSLISAISPPSVPHLPATWYPPAMHGDRLDVSEAARLLHVSERTIRRWLRQGLLCGSSAGAGIDRGELMRWAQEHDITIGSRRPLPPKPSSDLLAEAVERGAVTLDRDPASAAEAIEMTIAAVPGLDEQQRQALLADVLERERMASTALGHGVALPHPRKPPAHLFDQPVISVCFPERPLDWAALDGGPVTSVFLLLSSSAPIHLQILARVAFALRSRDFREFLGTRPDRERLVQHLLAIKKDE